jgi:hypothetical protein
MMLTGKTKPNLVDRPLSKGKSEVGAHSQYILFILADRCDAAPVPVHCLEFLL